MSNLVKYPRTMNFPWSGSNSSDDVWWKNADRFKGKKVVMTEKMDGEGTSMYRDHIHARSLDSGHHPSRTWIKMFHGAFAHEIPEGMRLCGENLYGFHSIFYTDLPSYFLCFGIYEKDMCLSWDETEAYCKLLGIQTAPVIYRGEWDEKLIRSLWTGKGAFPTFATTEHERPVWPDTFVPTEAEGYVVRVEDAFPYDEFRDNCAKYVRPNHVQTDQNWMMRPVLPNRLSVPASEST